MVSAHPGAFSSQRHRFYANPPTHGYSYSSAYIYSNANANPPTHGYPHTAANRCSAAYYSAGVAGSRYILWAESNVHCFLVTW